jgi:hypothetical protein
MQFLPIRQIFSNKIRQPLDEKNVQTMNNEKIHLHTICWLQAMDVFSEIHVVPAF